MRVRQLIFFSLLLANSGAFAAMQLNMPEGVTPISHDIYDLHMTILWICVAIGIVVFAALFYAIFSHHKSRGHEPAKFHAHLWLELTWTIVPFLILIGMAIPATKVLIHMSDYSKPDLTIKITGYQWKWRYEYLDYGVSFFSNLSTPAAQIQGKEPKGVHYLQEVDKPLMVPIHKKIRFVFTANDVIHSWWVPDLGVKRDAIPGFITESWARINRAGTYRGQCAELCGINHAYMPIVVVATTEKEFMDWINQQKKGEKVAIPAPAPVSAEPAKPAATTAPATTTSKATTQHTITVPVPTDKPHSVVITITVTPHTPSQPEKPAEQPPAPEAKTPAPASTPAEQPPAPEEKTPTPASATTPAAPEGKALTKEALMKQGETIYLNTCSVCHKPDGSGMPPVFPTLKGGKIITGPIDQHIDIVVNGKPGTAMQAFKDQLTDEEIAAVITYERNIFGNKDEIVQPSDVAAVMKK